MEGRVIEGWNDRLIVEWLVLFGHYKLIFFL